MGSLDERLAKHSFLGLDTSIFIYHLETHPCYANLTQQLLASVESGQYNKRKIKLSF
jgi:hypothetical protein